MKTLKEFITEGKASGKKVHIYYHQAYGRGASRTGTHLKPMSHEDFKSFHKALKADSEELDDHDEKHSWEHGDAMRIGHEGEPRKMEAFAKGGKGFAAEGEESNVGFGWSKDEAIKHVRKLMLPD